VALLIGLALINVGWVFNRSFAPLAEYKFRHEPFRRMQAALADVPALRVPAPMPYVLHLDLGLYLEATIPRVTSGTSSWAL